MSKFEKLLSRTFSGKRWLNYGFCNRKNHPLNVGYRKYRRGKKRCLECGAKIGKIKCVRKSFADTVMDDVFSPNPIFKLLKTK